MSKKLKLHIKETELLLGKQFTFKAPCDPGEIESLLIGNVTYGLCDALGNRLCKASDAWKKDAIVSVLLDTEGKKAFILNSTKALGTSPEDIGALPDDTVPLTKGGTNATSAKGARKNLGLGDTTGPVPVKNGGTGADSPVGAREALSIKSGSYTGTGSNRTYDTGMSNAKIIFIYGTSSHNDNNSFSGFLTPQGGVFTTEEILKAGITGQDMLGIRAFGRKSADSNGYNGYIAYFENGVITLNTDHYSVNANGQTYNYTCI